MVVARPVPKQSTRTFHFITALARAYNSPMGNGSKRGLKRLVWSLLFLWEVAWALLYVLSWDGTQMSDDNRFLALIMGLALPLAAIVPAALFMWLWRGFQDDRGPMR